MWVVYEEHEYFGTSILAIKSTREEAIEDITNRIKKFYVNELYKFQEEILNSISINENSITTKTGLKAIFVKD